MTHAVWEGELADIQDRRCVCWDGASDLLLSFLAAREGKGCIPIMQRRKTYVKF